MMEIATSALRLAAEHPVETAIGGCLLFVAKTILERWPKIQHVGYLNDRTAGCLTEQQEVDLAAQRAKIN